MIFPDGIIGPSVEQGDLVSFLFDGAELTLRVPKIPINRNNADEVSSIKDFRGIDTSGWDTNDQDLPFEQLILQRWCFEDAKSLDDVAEGELYLSVIEVDQEKQKKNILLSHEAFECEMLAWHNYSFGQSHNEKYAEDPNWPSSANRYHGRTIKKEHANWFVVRLSLASYLKPISLVMVPINSRFVMMAYIELQSLHYAGRSNPYSDELLKQFESDLFENFLSHIDLRYTPETIAIIESLKTSETA